MIDKKLIKDVIYASPIVFLFLANLYYINSGYPLSNLFISFGLYLVKNTLLQLFLTAFVTTLFFASIFGYVKYKTEKVIKEKKYKIFTPFIIGFKSSIIMFFILLLYLIGLIVIEGGSPDTLFGIIFGIPILVYAILTIIISGLIGNYFYIMKDKLKFRKISFYSLNCILIISLPSLYILENQYCITFGERSVLDCITKKAIQQDDPNFCLEFKAKGYGDVIGCVAKYSLSKRSPEHCKKIFDNTIFEVRCYEQYMQKGGIQYFDVSLCNETIDSEYCYQVYNYFEEKVK